jgi:outer membrane lipoprotein-sorting protein
VFLGFLAIEPRKASGDTKEPIVEEFRISDVTAEPGGADEGALSYVLNLSSCKLTAKVTLWYDAKSFLPKKRMINLSSQEEEVRLTETYDNWIFNATIPDSEFVIPADKYTDDTFKLPEEKK